MQGDFLQRVLFEDVNARAVLVRLDSVIREIFSETSYPAAVQVLLAESLLVVAMLSSGIKFRGRISLQLQSSGPLSLLMADCSEDGGLRGIARIDEESELPDSPENLFATLAGAGHLVLILEPAGGGQRWQGIVPLEGQGLDEAIEAYFMRSEQLPTRVKLAVGNGQASALMIQQMPGSSDDPDGWNRLEHLMATVHADEMLEPDMERLLEKLFHQENRRVFPSRELRFHCPCTRERVLDVLQGLGTAELQSMLEEQETVEVRCQFCNRAYHFDQFDLNAIIQSGGEGGPTVH
jgi:molecular chaperone Hsp33